MSNITHILPTKDIYPHTEEGILCDCNPKIELVNDETLVIHYAYDGRDVLEELDGI